MIHKIIPASRLTIIFILAVVLSGSVLTWFSINNISNLKELTEKRIQEEQGELAARFSSAIAGKLEKVTSGLSNEIILPDIMKDSLLRRVAEYEFITQPFILKKDGQFMYPNFIGISENIPYKKLSNRFFSAFNEGEKAEFSEKNPLKAKEYFLSCLKNSANSRDSVTSLNALGRISLKLNENDNALIYYNLIISKFFRESDGNEIPYVYYALPQLFKILIPANSDKIFQSVESCFERMESGTIPLSFSTDELLNIVTMRLKENAFDDEGKSKNIINLVSSIKQQFQFVNTYGNELAELVKKENTESYITTGNDFKVINSKSVSNQEFFLINTDFENPAGLLIDRNKFLEIILQTDLQSGLEFDYKIDLPGLNKTENTNDKLVFTLQLKPYFPEQLLEIRLSDKTLINNIINRRAWIYGISTVLLLVAMLLGVVLILRDIRREKHLARLRSDFISNVTHELKTPLTSIRMYAESLIMGRVKSDTVQKEYLSVVVNETDRLKRMINNILEFSKMEKGRPEYHFINSNLGLILRETLQEMNYWLEKEQFDVVTEMDDTIYAEVDSEKLKQAISNLLSNAIKYSTDIKKISVRLYRKPNHICIEVEDRGVGIPENELPRIFEPFYRIEQKDGISGTGLGLTVVKEIVEGHNGTISVTSEIRKGSRFTISLPSGGI